MSDNDESVIKSGAGKVFTGDIVELKNQLQKPTKVVIKTASGDEIELLLTTGSELKFVPAMGKASVDIYEIDDDSVFQSENVNLH